MYQDNDTTTEHTNYNVEIDREIIRTDADIVKELVEMRFLEKKRKIKLRTENDTTTRATVHV